MYPTLRYRYDMVEVVSVDTEMEGFGADRTGAVEVGPDPLPVDTGLCSITPLSGFSAPFDVSLPVPSLFTEAATVR